MKDKATICHIPLQFINHNTIQNDVFSLSIYKQDKDNEKYEELPASTQLIARECAWNH